MGTILSRDELVRARETFRKEKRRVVFTNGCFDILHRGHVEYLTKARALGDILIVGLNSDASVRRLKGEKRPITSEEDRAVILAALKPVDYVCVFEEDTPFELIRAIIPDVLVKGGDWPLDAVVGKDIVEAAGGTVESIAFIPDRSTTGIIEKIKRLAVLR